jgi:hypothetical protein
MKKSALNLAGLKEIIESIQSPERLNAHPLRESLFVQDFVSQNPGVWNESVGTQIILAVANLFQRMMPAVPPHQGKRLDSRWGEFGLLAAMYFAPLEFGAPQPSSLRDAWGRIDGAILSYVFREARHALSEAEIARYRLVSDEPEIGPASTISDWHRRGLERLAAIINREEGRLGSLANPSANYKKGSCVPSPLRI